MPLSNFSDYTGNVERFQRQYQFSKNAPTTTGQLISSRLIAPDALAAAPTTSSALGRASAGNLLQSPALSSLTNKMFLGQSNIVAAVAAAQGAYLLIDRLVEQGGLSGAVITAQATNLPTTALTRFTGGDGVCVGLQIYTQIGTTATTVTCSYTNQAGTSGRTTQAVVFGATNAREANRFIPLPLADGDTGVRAVASVTVLASTTTAGAFGVVLYRPLALIGAQSLQGNLGLAAQKEGLIAGGLVEVSSDACLDLIQLVGTSGALSGYMTFVETS